ncbi:MAG TPA: hypothetical protein VHN20_10270 [Beijerinckiaceae bacterium]|nr:hypothetical protein [Beijerinckiaceae bacterium]
MKHSLFGVAAFGLGLACVPAAVQAQQGYNGRWSVEIVTERGECDRAFRYPVIVENGRIRYGGDAGGFNLSGQIAPNGAVRVSITSGQGRADGTGKIAGSSGGGTWKISGSRACSGHWNAEKRS